MIHRHPVALGAAALLALAFAPRTPAQGPLFLKGGQLVQTRSVRNPEQALRALLLGPPKDATTAIRRGTTLVGYERIDGYGTVTLGGTFEVQVRDGVELEPALEQIQHTVLRTDPSLRGVDVHVKDGNGSITPLGTLYIKHHGAAHGPGGGAGGPAQARSASAQAAPIPSGPVSVGALAGRVIAISPGHGSYRHSTLGWIYQRPNIDGIIEDISNHEICDRYLVPALEDMGATVLLMRERGQAATEHYGDNDSGAPTYSETGSWITSASAGFQGGTYKFAGTAPAGAATSSATWTVPLAATGRYPVYAFYRGGSNRAQDARYTIDHTGGTAEVRIDQTQNDRTWVFLGEFWFDGNPGARITLHNDSAGPNAVVIADAVRVGAGNGVISRFGGTSGLPKWRECSRYWAEFNGAPATVYNSVGSGQDNNDDVSCRPRYAEWRGADLFLSIHTNAGGGSGTDTFIYSGGATAGSSLLQSRVHNQVVSDIRSLYDPTWVDRGQKTANFGELRLLNSMPGALIELAFHDQAGSRDHQAIHDPVWRRIAGEAMARGILRYFSQTTPFRPEPPANFRVTQDGAGALRPAWDAVPGAAFYSVEWSDDGKGFTELAQTPATSFVTAPLPPETVRSFRVRAWNNSGRSRPTEVLTAGTGHDGIADVLLVQGFDRLSRTVKLPENTNDYLRFYGDALSRDADTSIAFDACSNEALQSFRISLPPYPAVVWSLGEESTADDTFNAAEQFLVGQYLNGGGKLLVSGAEIGWELDNLGTVSDRNFYRNRLGATYAADDANTYTFFPDAGGIFAGLFPFGSFANGIDQGLYNVDFADVMQPTDGLSTPALRYSGSNGVAALTRVAGAARIVHFGFPLEAVEDPDTRAALMRRSLRFLLGPYPIEVPEVVSVGQSTALPIEIPGEGGQVYFLGASTATTPGVPLPGGVTIPLADNPYLLLGLLFPNEAQGFVGVLDPQGRATAQLNLPALPALVGTDVFLSGITWDSTTDRASQGLPWFRVRLR